MTAMLDLMGLNDDIRCLIDGEYICPDCVGQVDESEICPHRQTQLQAALDYGINIRLIDPDDPTYSAHGEWPDYCVGCYLEVLECATCGINCDCNYCSGEDDIGPVCDDCIDIDDFPSVETVLEAALAHEPIQFLRLRFPHHAYPAGQLGLFRLADAIPDLSRLVFVRRHLYDNAESS